MIQIAEVSNSDLPAFPIDKNSGLTKLEHVSIHIMSGLLSNEWCPKTWTKPEDLANVSVRHAKALLCELEKK